MNPIPSFSWLSSILGKKLARQGIEPVTLCSHVLSRYAGSNQRSSVLMSCRGMRARTSDPLFSCPVEVCGLEPAILCSHVLSRYAGSNQRSFVLMSCRGMRARTSDPLFSCPVCHQLRYTGSNIGDPLFSCFVCYRLRYTGSSVRKGCAQRHNFITRVVIIECYEVLRLLVDRSSRSCPHLSQQDTRSCVTFNLIREDWARIHQPFSRTFFVFVSKICKFECNTTSDWLNRTV